MDSKDQDPYLISEFGEIVPLRPDGCPVCGADFITRTAARCWRCHSEFEPLEELPETEDR